MWIFWATIGYFLNATAIAVDKSLLNRRELKDPAVYTLSISSLGLLVFLLSPWGLVFPTVKVLLLGLGTGAFFALGLWTMFMVLRVGEASRVPAFIGSLNPIFVFMFSWWLMGERLSSLGFLAFVLLALGGFLMVGSSGGLKGKWFWIAIISAVAFGLSYVFLKLTFNETNFISGLIWSRLGQFVASLALLLVPGTMSNYRASFNSSGSGIRLAFIGGQMAGALSGLLNSFAISLASVTLVNAMQGVQYVFLLIIAAIVSFRFPNFFKDEFSREAIIFKVSGTVLIGLGLWCLSLAT